MARLRFAQCFRLLRRWRSRRDRQSHASGRCSCRSHPTFHHLAALDARRRVRRDLHHRLRLLSGQRAEHRGARQDGKRSRREKAARLPSADAVATTFILRRELPACLRAAIRNSARRCDAARRAMKRDREIVAQCPNQANEGSWRFPARPRSIRHWRRSEKSGARPPALRRRKDTKSSVINNTLCKNN